MAVDKMVSRPTTTEVASVYALPCYIRNAGVPVENQFVVSAARNHFSRDLRLGPSQVCAIFTKLRCPSLPLDRGSETPWDYFVYCIEAAWEILVMAQKSKATAE